MYNTILVPLDGSKRAEAIMPHVENLAVCFGAKIILLQVVESHVVLIDGVNPLPDIQAHSRHTQAAETYLAGLTGKLNQKGLNVETRIAHGPVVEGIIKTAEHEKADLIAMASHGRTGLAGVFYGSVAAGVLHRVDRPLLLIRAEEDEKPAAYQLKG
jgi:nucleotide-binding universal stress UspA family protein